MTTKNYQNLLHKDLSYQIQGAAIEVRKDFGPGHKESIYQNAFAEELKSRNISFEKEKNIKIYSPKTNKIVGYYKPDFIIDNKVIVELKAVEKIPKMFIDQLYDYLRNSKYELGYFINFASPKLYIKRIIFTNDRKFFKLRNLLLVVLSFILVSISVLHAEAAELKLSSPTLKIEAGQQFRVDLLLNAKEESINALEGKIIFSKESLKLKKIQGGNSIVNFWIEKPKNDSAGSIAFSGITPGGVTVENGLIFSVIFETITSGVATLRISEARALLNDGQGSAASLEILPLDIAISQATSSEKPINIEISDTLPPESFRPEIAQDQNIFAGKYFLAFATQDKGSGMARYEVRELRQKFLSFLTSWKEAASPYLLTDQELKSYVFVKAVDLNGNEKIEVIPPKYPILWYENYLLYAIIILSLIVYILWKILRRKRDLSRQKNTH